MTEPREIELKLDLDVTAVEAFERMASIRFGLPDIDSRPLHSAYFDTRKHGLRRRGISLRVRVDGLRFVQTLKVVETLGILNRAEWEGEVPTDRPDPTLFTDERPREVLQARGALIPVFETNVERTTWTVREGRSVVEVAFDRGSVQAGGHVEPLIEIELELRRGSTRDLFKLAKRLMAIDGVRLGVQTKSERGYIMLGGVRSEPVKGEPIRLGRDLSTGDAFAVIARSCLKHFRLNEYGLVARRESESLHQARVAIRRLRSAVSIFGEVLADAKVDTIKGELKALSGKLGDARDIDVYMSGVIEPKRHQLVPEPGLDEHVERVASSRERAYDAVVGHLASKRFRHFTVDLASWIETGAWRSGDTTADVRGRAVWDFAKDELRRRGKDLRKEGRNLEQLDPERRHRVRISAKKLRYASEFFVSLLGSDRAVKRQSHFVSRLTDLQDELGALNDLGIGQDAAPGATLDETGQPPSSAFIVDPVTTTADAREETLIRSAEAAHRRFRRTRPF